MGKKEKYEEYNGMFHNGTDYAVYHMNIKEIVTGALAGGLAGGTVVMIFFDVWFLTVLSGPFCAIAGVLIYKTMLLNKRKNRLIIQFRDMLESVSSSLGSGRNVKDAFLGAYTDMCAQFGENAEIADELYIIKTGISSNVNMEALLQDFARRSHDENVQNFADVFSIANRRGGNIRQIVFETKNAISEKIMVEQDIQTVISGEKNELNIMMILPLIVVNQTKAMQGNTPEETAFNLLVKLAAFSMFIAAYMIGRKMMKIEV